MAAADSRTADSSVRGVRVSDLITGRIFAAASVDAAPECADGCALTGAADTDALLLIFCCMLQTV
jgi:hypothetical protein